MRHKTHLLRGVINFTHEQKFQAKQTKNSFSNIVLLIYDRKFIKLREMAHNTKLFNCIIVLLAS